MKKLFLLLSFIGCFIATSQAATRQHALIVANRSFLNQNAAIASTTLFTPTTNGTFRLTYYIDYSPLDDGSAAQTRFNWTDEIAPRISGAGFGAGISGPTSYVSGSFIMHDLANVPITFQTLPVGGNPVPPFPTSYNIYLILEEF